MSNATPTSSHKLTLEEAEARLNRLGLAEFEALFKTAAIVAEAQLIGSYRARFVGPFWLRLAAPLGLPLVGLKNWCGKRLDGSGAAVNRVERDGKVCTAVPMNAAISRSWLDRKDAYTLTYSSSYPWPLRHFRDELREWQPGYLIGMTWINLPLLRRLPMPFLLVREA